MWVRPKEMPILYKRDVIARSKAARRLIELVVYLGQHDPVYDLSPAFVVRARGASLEGRYDLRLCRCRLVFPS